MCALGVWVCVRVCAQHSASQGFIHSVRMKFALEPCMYVKCKYMLRKQFIAVGYCVG